MNVSRVPSAKPKSKELSIPLFLIIIVPNKKMFIQLIILLNTTYLMNII